MIIPSKNMIFFFYAIFLQYIRDMTIIVSGQMIIDTF